MHNSDKACPRCGAQLTATLKTSQGDVDVFGCGSSYWADGGTLNDVGRACAVSRLIVSVKQFLKHFDDNPRLRRAAMQKPVDEMRAAVEGADQ